MIRRSFLLRALLPSPAPSEYASGSRVHTVCVLCGCAEAQLPRHVYLHDLKCRIVNRAWCDYPALWMNEFMLHFTKDDLPPRAF